MHPGLLKWILQILFLSLAIAVSAIWISKSPMLEALRKKADAKNRWVGYALKCAFCMCGWISLVAILIYMPSLFYYLFNSYFIVGGVNILIPFNTLVSWFSLWGLATVVYRHLWPFLEKNAPKMRIRWSRS